MKFRIPKLKIQLFIKIHYKEVIAVLVVMVVLLFAWIMKLSERPVTISTPTDADYEQASKVRQKDCNCWDSVVGVCLPIQVCQIRQQ